VWRGAVAILAMQFLAGFGHMPLIFCAVHTSIVFVLGMSEG